MNPEAENHNITEHPIWRPLPREKHLLAETREGLLELAKAEASRLLNTPYFDFAAEARDAGLLSSVPREGFEWGDEEYDESYGSFLESLKLMTRQLAETFAGVVDAAAAVGQTAAAADFLKNIVLADRWDGSTMPAFFNFSTTAKPRDIIRAKDDIVSSDEIDSQSYRTVLYQEVVRALATCEQYAESALVACIKKMDIAPGPQSDDDDSSVVDDGGYYAHEVADRIKRDYFNTNNIDLFRHELSEFGKPLQLALAELSKQEVSRATVDYIITEFLNNTDAGVENFSAIRSIANQHPAYASQLLLKIISSATQEVTKTLATRLLYHIELGKIQLSARAVDYLGKRFEFAEPIPNGVFAHRLTGDGKVAIFDSDQRLLRYFELSGLDQADTTINTKLFQFSITTLFYPKPNETPNEQTERQQIVEEFKTNYFATYLTSFREETGVMFNNLSLREQGWFLWYAQHATPEEKQAAREFIKQYGEDGFKTFLSLEQNRHGGGRIIEIGNALEPNVARAVFKKYAEIAECATGAGDYMTAKFGSERASEPDRARAVAALLRQANELLADPKLTTTASAPDATESNRAAVLERLGAMRRDVMLFAETFKIASEGSPLEWNDMAGVELITKDSDELSPKEQAQLFAIFKANRAANPTDYPPELLAGRLQDFKELLAQTGKKFYLLKDGEVVIAFVHYENKKDENGAARYLGSFNVDPSGRGKKIGSAFLESTLKAEGHGRRVILNVNGGNQYLDNYLNKFGFTVQRIDENYRGSGKPYYFLERLPKVA